MASAHDLARRLDEDLLLFTTRIFGLHTDYLWHVPAKHIFPTQHFYKMPELLPHLFLVSAVVRDEDEDGVATRLWVDKELNRYDDSAAGSLYVLASSVPPSSLDSDDTRDPWEECLVGFVFRVKITNFRGRDVYRYYPFEVEPYCYWKVRYDVLSVIAIARWCQVRVRGRLASALLDDDKFPQGTLVEVCSGERFPFELTDYDPYASDRGHFRPWPIDELLRVDRPENWAAEDWLKYQEWSASDASYEQAVEDAKLARQRLYSAGRRLSGRAGDLGHADTEDHPETPDGDQQAN